MELIVDTSVFVEAERSRAVPFQTPLKALADSSETFVLGISVLTLAEMAFGYERDRRYSQAHREMLVARLTAAYNVYPVTAEVAVRAGALNAHLRRNGTPIGLADVLIAATALELSFGVLTHNTRHFSYVPELRVLDAANV